MYRDRHESYQCSNHYNVDRLCRVYSFSQSIDVRYECVVFFFQAEDGIRDLTVTGVQTCALPICVARRSPNPAALVPSMTMRSATASRWISPASTFQAGM